MNNKRVSVEVEQRVIHAYLESPRGERFIAKQMNIGVTTVQRILRRNRIAIPPEKYHSRSVTTHAFSPEQEAELVAEYRQRGSARAVAERRGACYATVLRVLKRHGVTVKMGKLKLVADPDAVATVVALTRQGVSRTELAQRFKVRHETITNWLRVGGINSPLRPGRKNCPGRWTRADGYVQVLLRPDDPLWVMRNVSGYVLEHRRVMAQQLGRPLVSSETVHHINGKRDDNRPENLELRVGKHGKGAAFVCADCGSHNIQARTLQ